MSCPEPAVRFLTKNHGKKKNPMIFYDTVNFSAIRKTTHSCVGIITYI